MYGINIHSENCKLMLNSKTAETNQLLVSGVLKYDIVAVSWVYTLFPKKSHAPGYPKILDSLRKSAALGINAPKNGK